MADDSRHERGQLRAPGDDARDAPAASLNGWRAGWHTSRSRSSPRSPRRAYCGHMGRLRLGPELAAGIVAALVAWRTAGRMPLVIGAGVGTFLLVRLLLG